MTSGRRRAPASRVTAATNEGDDLYCRGAAEISIFREDDLSLRDGTILTQPIKDDFIGFVFGYQGPLEENGDEVNDFKTFILSWKQYGQSHAGHFAEEGLTLAYIGGVLDDQGGTLWGHEGTPEYKVLATDYGEGRGWEDRTPIKFMLEYGAERIRIWLDEELVFDISAADAGVPFEPGRFGFYNYSQSDVIYSDFNARNDR